MSSDWIINSGVLRVATRFGNEALIRLGCRYIKEEPLDFLLVFSSYLGLPYTAPAG